MKKVLLLLLVILVAVPVSAQKKFTFGPRVGFTVADLHADDDEKNDEISGVRTGLVVGAFAEYRAVKWLAVSADVLFAQKGAENEFSIKTSELDQTTKNNFKLNYIDVPVLANFYVTKGLSATLDGGSYKETADLKDELNSVDFSIPVGISYTFKMGLVLDLRYHIGCTDLLKDGDYKLTNRVATLTVGWRF